MLNINSNGKGPSNRIQIVLIQLLLMRGFQTARVQLLSMTGVNMGMVIPNMASDMIVYLRLGVFSTALNVLLD